MILCMCRGVTDREIDQTIAAGANDVDDVIRGCGAGGDCGICRDDIRDRLASCTRRCLHAAA